MTALDNFVRTSATSYLQSVVFVDDEIYAGQHPLEASPIPPSLVGGLKPQFIDEGGDKVAESKSAVAADNTETGELKKTLDDKTPAAKAIAVVEPPPYHPRELMESFAQQGIVCALYEPRKGFKSDSTSILFSLCERADVVILDWDLYKDDGDGVSELLAELIKKSESALPHHVRLCAIYTNRPSLHPIMNMLLQKLEKRGCTVEVVETKLQLVSGATRISIFGKPVTAGRPPEDNSYEVKESDLAGRVISEFASLHYGLMPAFALHGLASVRRNTKRLLNKFRTELDGAFLLHRALVLNDGDACDELPELLSDEIRAVLEDTWPGNAPLKSIITATIQALPLSDPNPSWKLKNGGQPFDAKTAFRQMLLEGEVGLNDARDKCNEVKDLKTGGFNGIKATLLRDFDKMLSANGKCLPEQLAALFCNRTQYGVEGRRLRFGTVVRHKAKAEDAWDYSVCLMPICDSQRLAKEYAFPFWKLRNNVKEGLSVKRHGIAIDLGGGTQSLAAGGKIRDMLWTTPFTPSGDGWVVSVPKDGGFHFVTANMIIEWVAELKPLHAQRIAAYMGSEVSRVGLVESEWLRLFCDR